MSVIDGIQRKMCIVQKGNKMVRISLQVQVTDKTSIFKAQCTEKAWEWGSLIVEVWIRTEAATEWEKKVSYKENTQSSKHAPSFGEAPHFLPRGHFHTRRRQCGRRVGKRVPFKHCTWGYDLGIIGARHNISSSLFLPSTMNVGIANWKNAVLIQTLSASIKILYRDLCSWSARSIPLA